MTAKLFLFAVFVISMLLMSMNHRKRKKKVVFFGDSITEQGIRFGGYIWQLKNLLQEAAIDGEYELVASGVPGDKIYDLFLRMDNDILAKGADIVVIFIGINDVGHKFSTLTGTDIASFEAFYVAIIDKLLSAAIKVVLCTPAVIGEKPPFSCEVDEQINLYSDVIRNLAAKYELPIVDIRTAFVDYLLANNTLDIEQGILTTDKLHLNIKGNELVAEEIWKVLKNVR